MEPKVVVDSDVLIAVYRPTDSNHEKATQWVRALHEQGYRFVVSNILIQESTTVISHRMGMNDARKFYTGLRSFYDELIVVDEQLEKNAWDIFLKQTKKGCSFVDCSLVALAQYYSFEGVISFDSFYKKFGFKI